jgi:cation diffusion facilitator CzcD-associated flavoprotein CzcO
VAREVVVIGAGFGGIAAARALRRAGVSDVVVLERAAELGGTWRDNSYPGCRCDVMSNLYSFSFAPNPDWSDTYSRQGEIWAYLRRVALREGITPLIQFSTEVTDMSFDEAAGLWRLETTTGPLEARGVVLATGGLAEPRLPDIAGLDTFAGPVVHTGHWDPDATFDDRRVAVIGTGASAIQVVPQLAPRASHLDLYQRTPSWILPHPGHAVSARARRLYHLFPPLQRLSRWWEYWRREALVLGFVKDPRRMARGEQMARDFLAAAVADPAMREALTPSYRMGCKRVLLSDDFYPALARDNVDLVTSPIARVEPDAVVTADGTRHLCDVIVAATGFHVTDNPMAAKVHGRGGRTLADALRGDLATYLGTTFPGFPNLVMLMGPNTVLGHSSVVFMMEAQLDYGVELLRRGVTTRSLIEPRATAAERWTHEVRAKLPSTVWGTGCASWYLTESGVNTTIWPDFTFRFRRATKRFRPEDHSVVHATELTLT